MIFVGAFVYAKGTAQGQNTTVLLDLNRIELVERRQEKVNQIMATFGTVFQSNLSAATKTAIIENIKKNDASSSAAYTAMVRTLIQQMARQLPKDLEVAQT